MFDIASETLSKIITYALATIFMVVGNLTAIAAKGLNYAIFVRPGGNILIVATTWKIIRDFSNMFFIIILIYVAFATIFDHGNYTFQKMIVRFLIVAILINFSLVIGNLVIDACQVLTNIFLGSIGNLGDRLGQVLNPSLLLPQAKSMSVTDLASASVISLVFAIILSLIFLFSLLVAMVFAIVRVPIIWGLLIISPLAWMSHILPSSEGWWSKWWSQFFGWNLFLPVYLFFMYLGLLFLSQRDVIMNAVIQTSTAGGANPANGALLASVGNSISFNLLFFYLFAAFVMVGGTWAAKATTSLFGTGFDKGLDWAKWTVKNFPTPYVGSLTNWQEATKMRRDQFKREGVFGYLGTEKSDRQTARIAGGFFGVRDAKDKQLGSDVSTWKTRFNNLDTNQLLQQMNNGPIHQQLAMRELLKDRGQLSTKEMENTFDLYEKTSPASAIKFGNSIDYGKLSSEERRAWYRDTTNIELKKKIAGAMADKGDFDSPEQIREATRLFTLAPDKAEFLKKAARRITDNGVLADMMSTGTPDEQLAIREILTERQELGAGELWNTYKMFPEGSKEAQDFGKKIKFENLSKEERGEWYGKVKDVEVKRKIAESMADKGDFKPVEGDASLLEAASLFKLDAEKGEFLKKAQKKNFMGAMKARDALRLSKHDDGRLKSFDEIMIDQTKNMPIKDLAEISDKAWKDPKFQKAIINKLEKLQKAQIPQAPKKEGGKWTPGGGDSFKKKLRDALGGDPAKLEALENIGFTGELKNVPVEETGSVGNPEDEDGNDNKPPKATGVSYNLKTGIPNANVIDLRNNRDIEIK